MISSLRSENEALKLKVFEMMEKLGMISEEEEKQKLRAGGKRRRKNRRIVGADT